MPRKVTALYVVGACGWCPGDVLRGYKGRARYQKCLACHRVSYGTGGVSKPW